MKYLKTSDIAKSVGIHPNTVRLYEKWGLLPTAARSPAGYRQFTGAHLIQVKLIRLAMKCTLFGREVKKTAYGIINTSAAGRYNEALSLAEDLARMIEMELKQAEAAEKFLEQWAEESKLAALPGAAGKSSGSASEGAVSSKTGVPANVAASAKNALPENAAVSAQIALPENAAVSAKTAAHLLDITTDMLRDWERNGLIRIPRNPENGYRLYGPDEINKLRVIRALRRSNYSNMSILRAVKKLESGSAEGLREALNSPELDEDRGYLCFTDMLLTTLNTAKAATGEIIEILKVQI